MQGACAGSLVWELDQNPHAITKTQCSQVKKKNFIMLALTAYILKLEWYRKDYCGPSTRMICRFVKSSIKKELLTGDWIHGRCLIREKKTFKSTEIADDVENSHHFYNWDGASDKAALTQTWDPDLVGKGVCDSQDGRHIPQGVRLVGSLRIHQLECWRAAHWFQGTAQSWIHSSCPGASWPSWRPSRWDPWRRECARENRYGRLPVTRPWWSQPRVWSWGMLLGPLGSGHQNCESPTHWSPLRWARRPGGGPSSFSMSLPAPSADKVSDGTDGKRHIYSVHLHYCRTYREGGFGAERQ